MNHLFPLHQAHKHPNQKPQKKALPSSWYRSEALYALERRAIFSKKWMVVTHGTRFTKTGDYVQLNVAGYSYFIIKDRTGTIRAFHNVCRHRAYPVIQSEGESGTANIISCKYHGWSYGLDGKLAKAPRYQDVEGFEKEKMGLYPIHVHIDHLGFVWVNLEAGDRPSVSWEEDFEGVDQQPRLQGFDLSQYHFDHTWSMMGDYNWKTLADNYNECYHCPAGHLGVNAISDLTKYYVETKAGHIQHFNANKQDTPGLGIYSTFYFPNASITTRMEYDVYRHNDDSDKDFTYTDEFFKQVLREDKDLCNVAQNNLNAGVFGPLYFQKTVRELVFDHRKREEEAGKDIWPAVPQYDASDKLQEEIRFCEGLECSGEGSLEW
ncbi:Rieske [2Fe-2S] iron-sulfur domain-containing protein [Aspergillus novoparasiticus]|uniref:Choline monooxygenase, chloroplastic n=1 Tax=Aspergillus novoparasiticus TaxID=986946 RepID=A0A5N6ED05_9EURO|nr:Rieske [2Fe-2S] iron-sulfur domain-containing protein [Aspergillus novoparasiticus]